MAKDVLIMAGSESDRERVSAAFAVLDDAGVGYDFVVSSAHRSPEQTANIAKTAKAKGYRVVIAAAGLAAALPGAVAALTDLPVVGLPLDVGPLRGVDALYAIAQLPPGCPVGTVGIGNAKNAALLALRILGG
ncbi:MAG: AIR carboxylase family protein [Gemmatimonadota bacterium]|nr:AIR carboxylase family protein [Gemmatimonadota bacterium]MDH3367791.1 AIR carboxylase family protein [Gemmatimonadota bacterium]MDH3477151.1 AIR carboxylase family protein [Gemmatimonadota bacterium]MDH3570041.1 AIR carboxylase family protein [Gemmatimonadota bacterium]MDH5548537.1 AIR carboxylase family protein [Gemmatimonadota bacterium]